MYSFSVLVCSKKSLPWQNEVKEGNNGHAIASDCLEIKTHIVVNSISGTKVERNKGLIVCFIVTPVLWVDKIVPLQTCGWS